MISTLRGTVLHTQGSTAVIEVGGVGLSVTLTPQHALTLAVGQQASVHTALIVREDELSLYGFADRDGLAVFDLLRGVTGVGPKSAIGVLATMTPNQVALAVAAEDDAAFRKVSGIGPKTAKLIVLSLAGKLLPTRAEPEPVAETAGTSNLVAALVGLGWSERVAQDTARDVVDSANPADANNLQVMLRLALAQLGPQRSVTS